MGLTYFKRFRMEIDLAKHRSEPPMLPPGYFWLPWDPALVDLHAAVKYESFKSEIDSTVFPCLGDPFGCRQLMADISNKAGFLPEATWLIGWRRRPHDDVHYCGTIQGICDRSVGAVQNLGVPPRHRGRGLGRALLLKALEGFQLARIKRVYLEVTAQNRTAIELYRTVGFRKARTVYKAVEAEPVG
jgi:ribosomal protein S18 acetylase RimI-like enzyme